jgi:TP901 family phage tail tape measure protein
MATASDATSTLTGVMGNLTAAVRNTGLAMTVASGIAGGAMVAMAMNAQQVSSAFREVDTISREVEDSQREYGKLVSDLNTEFGLQANRMEVIDGLYQSVSAGVTEGAEAQREFLETAAQLAVVGRVDLATTVDVLSTVMNTYGLETDQAQDVSESLFETVQFGKVRMEELAPVLGRVAALASELDTKIDEIGASMAILTRTGFEARVAATGLRNIFRSMMRPSETMQQMLRDIALENDFFAESVEESASEVRDLANRYREATSNLDRYEKKQSEAQATTEEASLALQEARLKIQAIEEDRLEQLPELTNKQVKQAESVKELESVIDNYQFKVNKARVEQEKFRQDAEEAEQNVADLRKEFKSEIEAVGNLEGSIGSLVLGNQDFIDTLVELRQKSQEQNVAFNELFPRTRALQAALALVGEDGQALTEVFEQMESGTLDAREAWEGLDESARDNFESFEAFKASTEDVQDAGLQEWFNEATGEQVTMRNSIARLKEAIQDLGAIFSEDVTSTFQSFADSVERVSNFAKGMRESVRENVSQFMILLTTLGLVIGPLLLIGGQMALIAQALGPALIPFLAVAAGLFGALATGIKTAIEGGEGAESMFNTLRGVFNRVKSLVNDLRIAFMGIISPALITFGNTVISIFSDVDSKLGNTLENGGNLTTVIFNLAFAVRSAIESFNSFLQANQDVIVNGIVALVTYITSKAIPAVDDFVRGLMAVISEINWKALLSIAVPAVIGLAKAFFAVIGAIGRFMQNNSGLIGSFINIAAIVGSALAALGALSVVFSALGTAVGAVGAILGAVIVPGMSALGVTASILSAALAPVVSILSTIIPGFSILAKVASLAVTGFKVLAAAVGVLAGVLGLPVWATTLLIAALVATIAVVWRFRDEIWNALTQVVQAFARMGINIRKWLAGLTADALIWGSNLIDAFIQGIQNKYSELVSTLKGVAGTVKGYLGFSSSPPELGEDYNPENYGENVSTSFSEGMYNSEGKIETAVTDIAPTSDDFSVDMSTDELLNVSSPQRDMGALERTSLDLGRGGMPSSQPSGTSSGFGGKKVVVKEGAVDVGPFHGISDEELPERVEEEVDESLKDIMEEVEGSGRDATEQL